MKRTDDRILNAMGEIFRLIDAKDVQAAQHVIANLSDDDREKLAVVFRITAEDMEKGLALVREALSLVEVNDG